MERVVGCPDIGVPGVLALDFGSPTCQLLTVLKVNQCSVIVVVLSVAGCCCSLLSLVVALLGALSLPRLHHSCRLCRRCLSCPAPVSFYGLTLTLAALASIAEHSIAST